MPIRLLLVDDSETILTLLQELVRRDPEFQLVGVARNGAEAVALAQKHRPDLITMDLLMPEMDGLAAIRRLIAGGSRRIAVLTTMSGADISFKALEAGALEVLHKPVNYYSEEGRQAFAALLESLKMLGRAPSPGSTLPVLHETQSDAELRQWRFRGIAVAASTGGPAALKALLQELSPKFPLPLLLVQHMTEGFGPAFVEWLNHATALQVVEARSGDLPEPGKVHVAPDGHHLVLTGSGRLLLTDDAPLHSQRPSADILFESVGKLWRGQALALILTGMGRDGCHGLAALKRMGGRCLAQDEKSCQVFGMPAAAIEAGLADRVMSLAELARYLQWLDSGRARPGD